MARKLLIDAVHEEETRVVVLDGGKVEMFDFETSNKKQIVGNIYLARVTRVEPALQAVFVEYGAKRHGFLAFSEIHPDYYRLPVALREPSKDEAKQRTGEDATADEDASPTDSSAGPEPEGNSDGSADAKSGEAISGMEVIGPGQGSGAKEDLDRPGQTGSDADADAAPETEEAESDASDGASGRSTNAAQSSSTASATAKTESDAQKKNRRKFRIQEVIQPRQILLVQAVKDERGSKGAALTTYISLAGRYCVLMPNTPRGGGISRKITTAADRKKLEDIASGLNLPNGAGLIIRTAGAKRTKQEIKRDYDFLARQWEQVRQLTLKSIAPAPIYEEGGLIQRSVRDLYSKDVDTIIVQGAKGYRSAKDFMKLIMPSHAKKVQQYCESEPLFARYDVEPFLASLYSSVAQLSSGGYIVINPTEALISIDVNSGRATSHGTLEQTALQTNLEAAEEIARHLRLRDLAGLIVIDFIDMESRQHNAAVEKCLKEKTKLDRARVQIGRISSFGLLEMSRQRLRPGITEMTSTVCSECSGSGIVRSDESLSLAVLRNIEAKCSRSQGGEIVAKVPVRIANYIINRKRATLDQIESAYGIPIKVYATEEASGANFSVERAKNEPEAAPDSSDPIVSMESSLQPEPENDDPGTAESQRTASRRRRRRGGGRKRSRGANAPEHEAESQQENAAPETDAETRAQDTGKGDEDSSAKPSSRKKSRSPRRKGENNRASVSADGSSSRSGRSNENEAADRRKSSKPNSRDTDRPHDEQIASDGADGGKPELESEALSVIDAVSISKVPANLTEQDASGDSVVALDIETVSADFPGDAAQDSGSKASPESEVMVPPELIAQESAGEDKQSGTLSETSPDDAHAQNGGVRQSGKADSPGEAEEGNGDRARTGWWTA